MTENQQKLTIESIENQLQLTPKYFSGNEVLFLAKEYSQLKVQEEQEKERQKRIRIKEIITNADERQRSELSIFTEEEIKELHKLIWD